ncbi:hypothetical protein KIPB_004131 [Kipferlia bialata]|uniref:EamA domain-containing protein n=1 Tax=Kipferlia bialata TaxID=797122 RepID=A0A9K3CU06_9EUKA|nr:hypothetical protein KIPB_004131 [Kipferlia bialata]|eukprot:g4131.t1
MPQLASDGRVTGAILVCCVACLWVLSSELIQFIQTDAEWDESLGLTYLNTTVFIGYLLGTPFGAYSRDPSDKGKGEEGEEGEEGVEGSPDTKERQSLLDDTVEEGVLEGEAEGEGEKEWLRGTPLFKCAVVFSALYFCANLSFNASLARTSVASSTIISSLCSASALVCSAIILKVPVTVPGIVGVSVTICGVVCVALSETDMGTQTLMGDALSLLSAVLYGLYTTYVAHLSKRYSFHTAELFGYTGLAVLLLYWPLFLVWPTPLPPSGAVPALVINMLLGSFVSDLLWALSVRYGGPLIASVGISLSIPLSMVVDATLNGEGFSLSYVLGALMVLAGFAAVALPPSLIAKVVPAVWRGEGDGEGERCSV